VVVPSPAMSLVLVATSRTNCAPGSQTHPLSRFTRDVTPSLVMVGLPNLLSSTTYGPSGQGDLHSIGQSIHTRSSARVLLTVQQLFAINPVSFLYTRVHRLAECLEAAFSLRQDADDVDASRPDTLLRQA